jgi:outer membrane receptor protein involved in Fe transport
MNRFLITALIIFSNFLGIYAEMESAGSIKGIISEKTTGSALEFATIVVKNVKDTTLIKYSVTDKKGIFNIINLPFGEYKVSYSFIGFDKIEIPNVAINQKHKNIDLGNLIISETSKTLTQVDVVGKRSTFVNSIDRKTFNVGEDIMSKSGSVSDLMQNIPSVQVDVDGNLSLRGSGNVTILVDGKPSAMMNLNAAAILQQMPANSIDKIEIITNPSAKYKPDGTAGIINIVMKKNKSLGLNGTVTANVGNENRWNFNTLTNYNTGKLNLFGGFGMRRDSRTRITDLKSKTFNAGLLSDSSSTYTLGHARPIYYIGNLGFDYKLNEKNSFGSSVNFNYRYQELKDTNTYKLFDRNLNLQQDYNRDRFLPEIESDLDFDIYFKHAFDKDGHKLNIDFTPTFSYEKEDNRYTNTYRLPIQPLTKDNMLYLHHNFESQFSVEYTKPISESMKFEAGYLFEFHNSDMDLTRDTLIDLNTNLWNKDISRSNRFIRTDGNHVLYATYEMEIGKFGFLAGIRGEQTYTKSNMVTLDSVFTSQYTRIYPTLHLSYKLNDLHELQLNYSHRIRRPDDEELNPFPEYQDLNNIRAGNPKLLPEDIHSFEFGYQYKKESTTFLSTLYYRSKYNTITSITENLGNGVFKSTLENLDKSQSAGVELIFSTTFGKIATLNLATNTFYNTIDATLLGFSNNKSIISWSGNANISFNLTKSTFWQINSNYTAETLTPQGKRLPAFVMNTGLKQELFNRKAAIILSVSDIFNSNRNSYEIDTPDIYRFEIRKRSSQTIYLGFSYNFGSSSKKQKETQIKYDNQL